MKGVRHAQPAQLAWPRALLRRTATSLYSIELVQKYHFGFCGYTSLNSNLSRFTKEAQSSGLHEWMT